MRRHDTMWRDEALTDWHVDRGFHIPAAGLPQPFIEYDQGVPVGLVSYLPTSEALPSGHVAVNAYRALCSLGVGGEALPFFSVIYDLRPGWAPRYAVLAHNEPASALASRLLGPDAPWREMGEHDFARILYAMRGRALPDLKRYGIAWGEACGPSQEARFPGASMSARRRNFEPDMHVSPTKRIPCTDIDLMIPRRNGTVGLVVDYKMADARVDLNSSSLKALSGLCGVHRGQSHEVPAMVVRYDRHSWLFMVKALNRSASGDLAFALGCKDADPNVLASAIVGDWVDLTEDQWAVVLDQAAGR